MALDTGTGPAGAGPVGPVPASAARQPPGRVRALLRRPGIAHLIAAGLRFRDRLGWQFSAAITYFSFLAVIPIIMVAFAIVGYVLHSHPSYIQDLRVDVANLLPGKLSTPIDDALDQAIASRFGVGLFGLVVATYSGISWMGNLRQALHAQWRPDFDDNQEIAAESLPRYYFNNLRYLLLLGAGLLISLVLTAFGSAGPGVALRWMGIGPTTTLTVLFKVVAIAVAVVGDTAIFCGVYSVLAPTEFKAPWRSVLRGSFGVAIGFEILKVAAAIVSSTLLKTPTAQVFGPPIGILFFFYFTAVVVLFTAAWIATSPGTPSAAPPTGRLALDGHSAPDADHDDHSNGAGASVRAGRSPRWAGFGTGLAVGWLLRGRSGRR